MIRDFTRPVMEGKRRQTLRTVLWLEKKHFVSILDLFSTTCSFLTKSSWRHFLCMGGRNQLTWVVGRTLKKLENHSPKTSHFQTLSRFLLASRGVYCGSEQRQCGLLFSKQRGSCKFLKQKRACLASRNRLLRYLFISRCISSRAFKVKSLP